ncbi:MAG: hypothetical protein IPH35_28370 [Rhodoferax sp.]|nr:hypothetical protein [Rhodoferax sp.]
MELPEEKPDRNNALSRQLVSDLENLRDALTRLSLTLQDIAFDVETNAMSEVSQLTTALLVRLQAKEDGDKGGHR